ncbi:endopeptidase La [Faecalibaculum rodentium]|uniref:Lon protease n=1 Tax=Faecalibaculum rodentium TaxID=1702221 RepID=A0A140DXH0_9FIRM|nr:endopeptidase La [Faecalibaculum rodentium]AMK55347.1 ATP-dependent protease La [Faecalibaculum rodentium]
MEIENKSYSAPVLPVPGTLLLPGTTIRLKDLSKTDIHRLQEDLFVAVPVRSESGRDTWKDTDFYNYGVTCMITSVEDSDATAVTLQRVQIVQMIGGRFPAAVYELAADQEDLDDRAVQDMLGYIRNLVKEISSRIRGGERIARIAEGYSDINQLITYLAQYMPLSAQERFELLEMDSVKERCLHFIDLLLRQKEMISLNLEMQEKLSGEASKYYKEQALRRQIQALKEELEETTGEADGDRDDSFGARIMASDMPEEIQEAMLEEARKLENQSQAGPETDNIRTYLEFALSLPWKKEPVQEADLDKAREILNSRHYGMDKVKERIVQHLAVMRLRKTNKGSALLLVGPPGTGKTSLGKSIAEALDRPYVRMSLGGVRDESEIRGHRRTYVGSMAGRVLQSMKKAGQTNPVMILDEVDKLMQGGFSGDPAAAMLEVLDPEQNDTFSDHYLDQPYDLSDVFFIATANSLDTIPGPLLDRMEVIEVPSYTGEEKFHIAHDHLIPEVLRDHGIEKDQLVITDSAIETLVDNYTMEAGCRGLKKRIATIARHESEKILKDGRVTVEAANLEEILGPVTARHEKVKDSNPAGVVTGLAWTAVGGEVLFIETTDMPGTNQMILTGQLGDVMKESARIALSLLKSRLPMDAALFKDRDLHIHFPAGATPKDGPSAGITIFTALASLVTGRPVSSHLAMTGEVSLSGNVLPIGGLREKLYGAQRAGITKVLIPWDNRQDLAEVPASVKEKLEIVPVRTVEDVLRETLGIALPPVTPFVNPNVSVTIL